jgi:hypothetical protein
MNALRIALGAGLIALLLWQDLLAPSLLLLLLAHPTRLAIAFACLLAALVICAIDVAAVGLLMEPLTPGGLGVGEAAFARACDVLEAQRSGAAYATVFLAYRCLGFLAALPGAFFGPMTKERPEALRPATVAGRDPPRT